MSLSHRYCWIRTCNTKSIFLEVHVLGTAWLNMYQEPGPQERRYSCNCMSRFVSGRARDKKEETMKHEPQRYRVYNVGSRPQANQHFILDIFPGSCLLFVVPVARAVTLNGKLNICQERKNHPEMKHLYLVHEMLLQKSKPFPVNSLVYSFVPAFHCSTRYHGKTDLILVIS